MRNGAETESLMNSVERVLFMTNETPVEARSCVDQIEPSAFRITTSTSKAQLTHEGDHLRAGNNHKEAEGEGDSPSLQPAGTAEIEPDTLTGATDRSANGRDSTAWPHTLHSTLDSTLHSTLDWRQAELELGSYPRPRDRLPSSDRELLDDGWPWDAGVVFADVKMRYRADFDPVLKGVSIAVRGGESIGIIGRTGSGKSSILRALLRLTEIEEGQIFLGGVDISKIGLDALRSAISIIPQDPVLFSGSIRSNLDPFNKYSDEVLWTALSKANLLRTVRSLPGGLLFLVTEGGENFRFSRHSMSLLLPLTSPE